MIFRRSTTQAPSLGASAEGPPGVSVDDLEEELHGLLRPRIGITGSLGRGNYGDELFVRVYEHWIGYWADLTLLTGIHRPWYFRELRTGQVDAMDAIVLGGGDLICPHKSWLDPDFVNPMYLRRNVYVAGIGVERESTPMDPTVVERWSEFLTHPSVQSISVRDEGSAEWIAEQIHPDVDTTTHADLVCALPMPEIARRDGQPVLGIVTRYVRDSEEYRLLEEIAKGYLAKGWRVRHIIGGIEDHGRRDLANADELLVDGKETVHTKHLDEITQALGECTVLLSMKLHTTIVATLLGVPTICVHPVAKTHAFMAEIGRPELVLEPTDRRLVTLLEEGVPEVPMDAVAKLRESAVNGLRVLSQRIWDDYRNRSAVRQHILPASVPWRE